MDKQCQVCLGVPSRPVPILCNDGSLHEPPSGNFVVVKLDDNSGRHENVRCLKYGDLAYVSYWTELLPEVFNRNNGDEGNDDEEGGVASAAAAAGDRATGSSSSSSSHVNSVPAATLRHFKTVILPSRANPDARLKQMYERPNPLCYPKGSDDEHRAAENLDSRQMLLQRAKDEETTAYESWFNVMSVFVWDPLHQFESHGFDRFPCKYHGFECPEERATAPVSETGQFRMRFVNDIAEPYALASPRLMCHTCVSRKKAIATRLLQRGVPDDEKKARTRIQP